jgi:hypothetical protein
VVHKSEPTTVLRQAHKSEPNYKQSFAKTRKSTVEARWIERAVRHSNALITFKTHGPRPSRSAESARRAAGWGRVHARGLDASLQTPVGDASLGARAKGRCSLGASLQTPVGDASLGARAKGRCGMGRYAGLAPSQHGLVGV